jgi:predicted alpha-1,2-mannosidase
MASAAVLMAIILTGGAAHGARVTHPEDFVNLLGGTFTDGQKFSTGNTLPLVGRPWGFNHWSPQSNPGRSSWWFSGEDHTFRWIRCTHQPSPWIGDYAWFMWGPQMGNIALDPVGFWEPRAAVMRPYMFDATTGPDGMRIELTPSMHGAIMRVTFPAYNPHGLDKRVCLRLDDSDWHVATKGADGRGVIKGTSMRVNGRPANFRFHIHAESDEEVVKVEKNGNHLACFTYAKDATVVTVRAATSFIDGQQALTSYQREVGKDSSGHDFDSLKAEAREEWRSMLGRVEVVDPGDDVDGDWVQTHLTIFYTGLYRALSFPRRLDEVASDGSVVHYSAYAPRGGTGRGPLCTDNGFWDTFRTVYPMLSLLYPDKLGGIIQGWLNAYKAGGWLPQWSSPGYRQSMVGTFSDVIVADAIVKKVPGFEVDVAWSAIRRDSFEGEPPGDKGVGKVGLSIYDQHKYIPSDVGVSEMVSRSLDFAFADVAVANAATLLAKQALTPAAKQRFEADASKLRGRGMAVMRNLFDRKSGLMRPKNKNGEFDGNFFANRWGGPYTEGSAWHHSFPPFDVEALAKLHGGAKHLLAKLHELVNTAGTFQVGGYGQEIHEMTEMRAGAFGQYGHNNQPCHHQLYLFALLGEAATTQKLVRRVMDHSYGVDFYAGDEDNGEQGAWFVLSALGLYSVAPGASNEYVLGSPIFRHVAVHLPALEEATALKVGG